MNAEGGEIALCADSRMIPGLHVVLYSALTSMKVGFRLTVHLFSSDLSQADVAALRETIQSTGQQCTLKVHPADISAFKSFRPLRGNWMTYARLALPNWLPDASKVLYLDSDLLVTADVSKIFDVDLQGASTAFVNDGGIKANALENALYREIGLDLRSPCYNAGVILMDLDKWRELDLSDHALGIANAYQGRLLAADQTVLNILFDRIQVSHLASNMNIQVYPEDRIPVNDDFPGIYHFIGAPKPWDPFGLWVNVHGAVFSKWLNRTAYRSHSKLGRAGWFRLRVFSRDILNYLRVIRRRFQMGTRLGSS